MSFARLRGLLLERRSWLAAPERPAPSHPVALPVMPIGHAFAPADVPALCNGIRIATGDTAASIVCDASALVDPRLETVDGLARLTLALRRRGYDVRLGQAPVDLIDLIALVGLADVVPCAGSVVEARGEAEHREELGGVEEEDDPADAAG
jgi:hypothetical protein